MQDPYMHEAIERLVCLFMCFWPALTRIFG